MFKLLDEALFLENPVHHANALNVALLACEKDVRLTVPRVLGKEVKVVIHRGKLDALDLVQLRLENARTPSRASMLRAREWYKTK